nr:MAG TPA: CCSMST1 family protein [Caudoviricetes sp.]
MWEYFYLYNIFIFLIYTIYFCFFLTKDTIKEK